VDFHVLNLLQECHRGYLDQTLRAQLTAKRHGYSCLTQPGLSGPAVPDGGPVKPSDIVSSPFTLAHDGAWAPLEMRHTAQRLVEIGIIVTPNPVLPLYARFRDRVRPASDARLYPGRRRSVLTGLLGER
jgi:hypothetical protein